jgi:hypothetical protein
MSFVVIFQTGGSLGSWRPVLDGFGTKEAAKVKRDELCRMGYPAYVAPARVYEAVGLPEGPAPSWDYRELRWKVGREPD